VQAHTLGEVGNLGTVSLRVSSGTILPIFIEIGSYLADKEQKISWHSFLRHGVVGTRARVGDHSSGAKICSTMARESGSRYLCQTARGIGLKRGRGRAVTTITFVRIRDFNAVKLIELSIINKFFLR